MRRLVLLSLTLAIAGCSKPAAPGAANSAAAPAVAISPSEATATRIAAGRAFGGAVGGCDHPVSRADVQPLLTGPITAIKPAPSDPDSCVFSTAGYSSISVTVRSTGGKQTLETWRKGPVTPVPGVGDDAVWEPRIQELVASQGDTLCTVMAMGSEASSVTAASAGTVCNKAFAGG